MSQGCKVYSTVLTVNDEITLVYQFAFTRSTAVRRMNNHWHRRLRNVTKPDFLLSRPEIVRLYRECVQDTVSNATVHGSGDVSSLDLMSCMALFIERYEEHDEKRTREFLKEVMLVFAAALAFLMQAGFAMLCAGSVRKKNVQNTMLKNLLDTCGASVAYFLIGYSFSYGGTETASSQRSFIGFGNFCLQGVSDYSFWLFQYTFSATTATIVAGTLVERCQMVAYLAYSIVLTGFVYPIVVHAIWSSNGYLSASSTKPLFGVGVIDFAGSGVVHVTGGVTALFATTILGPRRGRFHDESGRRLEQPRDFEGQSSALRVRFSVLVCLYDFCPC